MDTFPYSISQIKDGRTRSISAENPEGKPGYGGMAIHPLLGKSRKGRPALTPFEAGKIYTLASIKGPAIIQSIWVTTWDRIYEDKKVVDKNTLRDIVLRMYWDDEKDPSVEVPLGDFFCNGFARRALVNSLPIVVNPYGGFNCFFPMPFKKMAKITVENQGQYDNPHFFYQINYCLTEIGKDCGYFHAFWNRQNPTIKKEDYIIVDKIKGKGHYVGTYIALNSHNKYWWGEGEMKFFIDEDRKYPTICGTGLEDYVGGAWCFVPQGPYDDKNVGTYSTPFIGYPYCSYIEGEKSGAAMHSLYRWHIPDPIRFSKRLKVTLQQIGAHNGELFERSDDISSVAYWYQVEPHNKYNKITGPQKRRP